jgi:hypothetical protein
MFSLNKKKVYKIIYDVQGITTSILLVIFKAYFREKINIARREKSSGDILITFDVL